MVALSLCCFVSSHVTPPTSLYPLSLHDALPISAAPSAGSLPARPSRSSPWFRGRTSRFWRTATSSRSSIPRRSFNATPALAAARSEEHTSELQSRENLVCRLLLEKKKANNESSQ